MLIVVRHGRTPANAAGQLLGRRDPELDDVGRAQAAAIGAALTGDYRIISSPLQRCQQTASAIGAQVETDDALGFSEHLIPLLDYQETPPGAG